MVGLNAAVPWLIGVSSGAVVWKVFPYFTSGAERWRTSVAGFLFRRLASSVLAGALTIAFVTNYHQSGEMANGQAIVSDASPPPASDLQATEHVEVIAEDAKTAPDAGNRAPSTSLMSTTAEETLSTVGGQRPPSSEQSTASANGANGSGGAFLKTSEPGRCENSQTYLEKRVCEDASLYALDQQLAGALKDALLRGSAFQVIEAEQSTWRENVLVTCYDEACLRDAMTARIAELTDRHRR